MEIKRRLTSFGRGGSAPPDDDARRRAEVRRRQLEVQARLKIMIETYRVVARRRERLR